MAIYPKKFILSEWTWDNLLVACMCGERIYMRQLAYCKCVLGSSSKVLVVMGSSACKPHCLIYA